MHRCDSYPSDSGHLLMVLTLCKPDFQMHPTWTSCCPACTACTHLRKHAHQAQPSIEPLGSTALTHLSSTNRAITTQGHWHTGPSARRVFSTQGFSPQGLQHIGSLQPTGSSADRAICPWGHQHTGPSAHGAFSSQGHQHDYHRVISTPPPVA